MTKEYWAFLSPSMQILPSTMREKFGDAESALEKTCGWKYEERYWKQYFTAIRLKVKVLTDLSGSETVYLKRRGFNILEANNE